VQDNTNFPDGIATSKNNANKVCLSCKSRGLCTSDLTLYLCSKCGKKYGRKLFPRSNITNVIRTACRNSSLTCCGCCQKIEHNNMSVRSKIALLLTRLKDTKAHRCTCGRFPKKHRAHWSLNHNLHSEQCKLYDASGPNWEGKHVGITKDDLRFLEKHQAY
jgi:hypothetical protein